MTEDQRLKRIMEMMAIHHKRVDQPEEIASSSAAAPARASSVDWSEVRRIPIHSKLREETASASAVEEIAADPICRPPGMPAMVPDGYNERTRAMALKLEAIRAKAKDDGAGSDGVKKDGAKKGRGRGGGHGKEG